jgi:hypothetical protein
MPVQAWKISIFLSKKQGPHVSLRTIDDRGRLSHLVVADDLSIPIGEAMDDAMNLEKNYASDREHLRSLGKI